MTSDRPHSARGIRKYTRYRNSILDVPGNSLPNISEALSKQLPEFSRIAPAAYLTFGVG